MKLLYFTITCCLLFCFAHALNIPLMTKTTSYKQAAQEIWHHDEPSAPVSMKNLVRYATLAPSGHNTQCWKFRITTDHSLTISPDLGRATRVVDPDDHHVYVSLGCAVENLAIAGLAHGLEARVDSTNPVENGIQVDFVPCQPQVTPRYNAIFDRRVSRAEYNGEKLTDDELKQLKEATNGANGVEVHFLTDSDSISKAQEYILRANALQMNDKNFRDELKEWIRFSQGDCVTKRDGLTAPVMNNPFVPQFFGNKIFDWTATPKRENDKIERNIASSAGLAVFVSQQDDASHWVEAGRVYQRFALEATTLGVKNAFLNQPVEVAEVRPEFARAFGLQGRPDLIVRFGKGGPDLPHSLRRPVEQVIVE